MRIERLTLGMVLNKEEKEKAADGGNLNAKNFDWSTNFDENLLPSSRCVVWVV